jgi:hypothetical protein
MGVQMSFQHTDFIPFYYIATTTFYFSSHPLMDPAMSSFRRTHGVICWDDKQRARVVFALLTIQQQTRKLWKVNIQSILARK